MNLKDLKTSGLMAYTAMMIAGPCSAESEAQMLETAKRIKESNANVSVFRAGIWKPVQNQTDLKE
jgi:chorismate mutase